MGHASLTEKDVTFTNVAWGRTATVFGPENVDSRFVRIKITEYAPGTGHRLHRHPEEEVIFVLEGSGISRTDAGDRPMFPGTFVFVPADTDHTTINLEPDRSLRAVIINPLPERSTSSARMPWRASGRRPARRRKAGRDLLRCDVWRVYHRHSDELSRTSCINGCP